MALVLGKSITKGDVEKLQKRVTALSSRAKNAVEKADRVVEKAVTALETTSAAFGLGWFEGHYGPKDVMGVPLGLIVGGGLHAFAFVTESEMGPHMHAFGNGALASYAAMLGRDIGAKMALEGTAPAAPAAVSRVDGSDSLSADELRSMAP